MIFYVWFFFFRVVPMHIVEAQGEGKTSHKGHIYSNSFQKLILIKTCGLTQWFEISQNMVQKTTTHNISLYEHVKFRCSLSNSEKKNLETFCLLFHFLRKVNVENKRFLEECEWVYAFGALLYIMSD